MPKPATTAEPAPRHPVKEDASFPRVKNGRNPANPFGVEAPGLENSKETPKRRSQRLCERLVSAIVQASESK